MTDSPLFRLLQHSSKNSAMPIRVNSAQDSSLVAGTIKPEGKYTISQPGEVCINKNSRSVGVGQLIFTDIVIRISVKTCPRRKALTLSRMVFLFLQPEPKGVALALAMSRDGSSGGLIRMMILTGDKGPERLKFTEPNIPRFWEKQ